MSREMTIQLGGVLGSVKGVDCAESRNWEGACLHIRIKPLQRGIKFMPGKCKEIWCPIQYERLTDFCYCCGLLEHMLRECVTPALFPLCSVSLFSMEIGCAHRCSKRGL